MFGKGLYFYFVENDFKVAANIEIWKIFSFSLIRNQPYLWRCHSSRQEKKERQLCPGLPSWLPGVDGRHEDGGQAQIHHGEHVPAPSGDYDISSFNNRPKEA